LSAAGISDIFPIFRLLPFVSYLLLHAKYNEVFDFQEGDTLGPTIRETSLQDCIHDRTSSDIDVWKASDEFVTDPHRWQTQNWAFSFGF
jgi:hypothetical protein